MAPVPVGNTLTWGGTAYRAALYRMHLKRRRAHTAI